MDEMPSSSSSSNSNENTIYKGHEFIGIHFRTPTSCDSCQKPVWHVLHPPTALECKRTL